MSKTNGHTTRFSDSSLYDEVCTKCGATDARGDDRLEKPCPLPDTQDQGWRDIESAPKDEEVFIGCWIDGEFQFGKSVCFYEKGNEMAGECYEGWFWSIDDCPESVAEFPTHWMPLPSPPEGG